MTRFCTSFTASREIPTPPIAGRRGRLPGMGLRFSSSTKFVPGLDAVAPPLAGTSGTSRLRFLTLETTGAALYSCVYAGLGYVFSHDLDRVAAYAGRAGTLLGGLALGVLAIYGIRKLVRWRRLNARVSACADHNS